MRYCPCGAVHPLPSSPVIFREYQVERVRAILRHLVPERGQVLLNACVGAGKTKMSLAAAALLLADHVVSHVIFVAPSRIICEQFDLSAGRSCRIGALETSLPTIFDKSKRASEYENILRYLSDSEPRSVAVGTFYLLRTLVAEPQGQQLLRDRGQKLLVVIDEAHYTGADDIPVVNDITSAKNECRLKYGTRLLRMTGTARRSSETETVFTPGEAVVRWTLPDHILAGFVPELRWNTIPISGKSDSDAHDVGIPRLSDPAVREQVLDSIVKSLQADGWPKAIVRVKVFGDVDVQTRLAQRQHAEFVSSLVERLRAHGKVAVSLYGDSEEARQGLLDAVALEDADRGHHVDQIPDIYVTLKRSDEGADLPARSHLYLIGCPVSDVKQEQLIGRVLRSRVSATGEPLYSGYAPEWLHVSKVVFLVACAMEKSERLKFDTHVGIQMMKVTSLAHVLRASSVLRAAMVDGFAAQGRRLSPGEGSIALEEVIDSAVFKKVCAAVAWLDEFLKTTTPPAQISFGTSTSSSRVIAKILTAPSESGDGFVVDDIVREFHVDLACESTLEEVKRAIALRFATPPGSSPPSPTVIARAIAEQDAPDLAASELLSAALLRAYEVFCQESYKVELGTSSVDAAVVEAVTRKLSESLGLVPHTVEGVLAAVDTFRAAHDGRYPNPSAGSGHVDARGILFAVYDGQIRRGALGDAGFSRFSDLVLHHRGGADWFDVLSRAARDWQETERVGDVVLDYGVKYGDLPEVAFFPKALLAVRHLGDVLRGVSLEEADRIGRLLGRAPEVVQEAASQSADALRALVRRKK